MNRERAKGVLAFFALFLIGLAVYGVFDAALAPSKPMVQEEPQPTEGVSKVAAQVSPSVVGITSFKRGQIERLPSSFHWVLTPRSSNICSKTSTSLIRGTLSRMVSPSAIMLATIKTNPAFFAPLIRTCP
jgi:hypothetical protein